MKKIVVLLLFLITISIGTNTAGARQFKAIPPGSRPYRDYAILVKYGGCSPIYVNDGNGTLTRYEFAVLTCRVQRDLLARRLTTVGPHARAIRTALTSLVTEFKPEIKELGGSERHESRKRIPIRKAPVPGSRRQTI